MYIYIYMYIHIYIHVCLPPRIHAGSERRESVHSTQGGGLLFSLSHTHPNARNQHTYTHADIRRQRSLDGKEVGTALELLRSLSHTCTHIHARARAHTHTYTHAGFGGQRSCDGTRFGGLTIWHTLKYCAHSCLRLVALRDCNSWPWNIVVCCSGLQCVAACWRSM